MMKAFLITLLCIGVYGSHKKGMVFPPYPPMSCVLWNKPVASGCCPKTTVYCFNLNDQMGDIYWSVIDTYDTNPSSQYPTIAYEGGLSGDGRVLCYFIVSEVNFFHCRDPIHNQGTVKHLSESIDALGIGTFKLAPSGKHICWWTFPRTETSPAHEQYFACGLATASGSSKNVYVENVYFQYTQDVQIEFSADSNVAVFATAMNRNVRVFIAYDMNVLGVPNSKALFTSVQTATFQDIASHVAVSVLDTSPYKTCWLFALETGSVAARVIDLRCDENPILSSAVSSNLIATGNNKDAIPLGVWQHGTAGVFAAYLELGVSNYNIKYVYVTDTSEVQILPIGGYPDAVRAESADKDWYAASADGTVFCFFVQITSGNYQFRCVPNGAASTPVLGPYIQSWGTYQVKHKKMVLSRDGQYVCYVAVSDWFSGNPYRLQVGCAHPSGSPSKKLLEIELSAAQVGSSIFAGSVDIAFQGDGERMCFSFQLDEMPTVWSDCVSAPYQTSITKDITTFHTPGTGYIRPKLVMQEYAAPGTTFTNFGPIFPITDPPTDAPTRRPSDAPTKRPTDAPTKYPTDAPSQAPSKQPTLAPSPAPTNPFLAETCQDAAQWGKVMLGKPDPGTSCHACARHRTDSEDCHWCSKKDPVGMEVYYGRCTANDCNEDEEETNSYKGCKPNDCFVAPPAYHCRIPLFREVPREFIQTCALLNDKVTAAPTPPTPPTPPPPCDECCEALKADGNECSLALLHYQCSQKCQRCSPELSSPSRAFTLLPCLSVCVNIQQKCPTYAAACASLVPRCHTSNDGCAENMDYYDDPSTAPPLTADDTKPPTNQPTTQPTDSPVETYVETTSTQGGAGSSTSNAGNTDEPMESTTMGNAKVVGGAELPVGLIAGIGGGGLCLCLVCIMVLVYALILRPRSSRNAPSTDMAVRPRRATSDALGLSPAYRRASGPGAENRSRSRTNSRTRRLTKTNSSTAGGRRRTLTNNKRESGGGTYSGVNRQPSEVLDMTPLGGTQPLHVTYATFDATHGSASGTESTQAQVSYGDIPPFNAQPQEAEPSFY